MRMDKGGVKGVGKEPHSRVETRVSKGTPGQEKKADVKGAEDGGSMAEVKGDPMRGQGLKGAVEHLHSEHPVAYHDHGPHHGTDHHIRHEPLHGMKPTR